MDAPHEPPLPLGGGTFLFRWPAGSYFSPFLVGSEGVVAVDPINRDAAVAYRQAIASVTAAPVVMVVYSHDHRDHIVGSEVLAPDAEVAARPHVADRIRIRDDRDITSPSVLLDEAGTLEIGDVELGYQDFGPCHSGSNLALTLPSGQGPLLVYVDVVEPEVTPYRELPDTDLRGLLEVLSRADQLDVTSVMGGHTLPGPRDWLGRYRAYFRDLIDATGAAFTRQGGQTPRPGEDGIAMTERVRGETCREAAAELRSVYGGWRGFEEWAPRNADRVLSYLITGN